MSEFVDANVFIRMLMGDDPERTRACGALFAQAQRGEVDLHTSEAIVAEVVFVLKSKVLFGLSRAQIAPL